MQLWLKEPYRIDTSLHLRYENEDNESQSILNLLKNALKYDIIGTKDPFYTYLERI